MLLGFEASICHSLSDLLRQMDPLQNSPIRACVHINALCQCPCLCQFLYSAMNIFFLHGYYRADSQDPHW
jgi:hypothetical protein